MIKTYKNTSPRRVYVLVRKYGQLKLMCVYAHICLYVKYRPEGRECRGREWSRQEERAGVEWRWGINSTYLTELLSGPNGFLPVGHLGHSINVSYYHEHALPYDVKINNNFKTNPCPLGLLLKSSYLPLIVLKLQNGDIHFSKLCCPATLAFSLSPKHRLSPARKLVHSSSPAKLLHSLHPARRLNPLLREAGSHLTDL